MLYSGLWHHVGLVKTDVSEERVASILHIERMLAKCATKLLTLFIMHRFFLP
jgi:hypothetical protein